MAHKPSLFTHPESLLLSISIVSYNTRALTLQTITTVLAACAHSPELQKGTEIIVVDNNSNDGSLEALQELAAKEKSVSVIANTTNAGFAKANNQAILASKGTFILLLNSDTEVAPDALQQLLTTMGATEKTMATALRDAHPNKLDNLGILSAALFNPDLSPQSQGGDLPTLTSLKNHFLFLDDLPFIGKLLPSTQHTGNNQHNQSTEQPTLMGWVAGTAMLVRRSVFAQIGLLDEAIFMYGEDMEFCLRAAKHHIDCAIDQKAHVIHLQSASSGSANALLGEIRGYLYIWSKHKPLWQYPFLKAILFVGCFVRWVVFGTIKKNTHKASIYTQAMKLLS